MARCNMNCLECQEEDCIEEAPMIDVEQFIHYVRWDNQFIGVKVKIEPVHVDIDMDAMGLLEEDEELYFWCDSKGVMPRTKGDVAILRRAYEQGFQGKKLEKAIYKVRHREEYLAQKRRWHKRQQMKKAERI